MLRTFAIALAALTLAAAPAAHGQTPSMADIQAVADYRRPTLTLLTDAQRLVLDAMQRVQEAVQMAEAGASPDQTRTWMAGWSSDMQARAVRVRAQGAALKDMDPQVVKQLMGAMGLPVLEASMLKQPALARDLAAAATAYADQVVEIAPLIIQRNRDALRKAPFMIWRSSLMMGSIENTLVESSMTGIKPPNPTYSFLTSQLETNRTSMALIEAQMKLAQNERVDSTALANELKSHNDLARKAVRELEVFTRTGSHQIDKVPPQQRAVALLENRIIESYKVTAGIETDIIDALEEAERSIRAGGSIFDAAIALNSAQALVRERQAQVQARQDLLRKP